MKTLINSGRGWLVTMVLCSLALAFSLPATAATGDEHWDPQFGWPGPGGFYNFAITTHGSRIYVSGDGSSSTNVALEVWDGAQWSAEHQFYGAGPTVVLDLAFAGNDLYALGYFTNVDGVAASGFARWNGSNWTALAFTGIGYQLAVNGNNIYVGGNFINPGGVTATNIGYWDGNLWHALGDGLGNNNYSDVVRAIIVTNGLVYAGGSFTNSGALPIANLAVWDGSGWSEVGGGVSGTVEALAQNGNDLYVGGTFTQAGATPANNIAVWNGSAWTALGTGLNGTVSSIVLLSNLVEVTGTFTAAGGMPATNFAIWSGSSWAAAGSGLSSGGTRAVSTGTNVYVVGNFLTAGGLIANALASWDGTRWSAIGTPGQMNGVASTVQAIAADGTNIYAAGAFTAAGQTAANYIARFDGKNWHPLGTGLGGSSTPYGSYPTIHAIAVAGNNVYVGGSFTSAGGVSVQNIARWDGTNWYAMGNPGGLVYSIILRTNGIYAAGSADGLSGYTDPFFSRWDGTNWQDVLNFNITNTFYLFYLNDSVPGIDAVAPLGANVFIGGHFSLRQDDPTIPPPNEIYTNCNNILRFDGTYANIVGTGLDSNVVAMAVVRTNLYVAGPFANAGGIAASQIAMWNGNSWSDVGGGVVGNGTIYTLAAVGNDLYAGGNFTNMDGIPVNHIAKWDGTNWSALGSGVVYSQTIGTVDGVSASGTGLYVGGTFRMAGDKASYFVARWNDQVNFDAPQLTNPAWLTNHQFQARLFGISGMTNIVEASTNLTGWTPILTNTDGIYNFTDPSASGYPHRFYRAILGP